MGMFSLTMYEFYILFLSTKEASISLVIKSIFVADTLQCSLIRVINDFE